MLWGNVLTSLIYIELSLFPKSLVEKTGFSPLYNSCSLCHALIYHEWIYLFLDSLFCFIGMHVCFCASAILFWLLWLCSIAWSPRALYLQLCSFLQNFFDNFGLLLFCINLKFFFFNSLKNLMNILIGIMSNL